MPIDEGSPNAAEERFWNTETGQTWVELQEALDETFSGISQRLYEHAAAAAGEKVLDIGCGAGTTTMAFASRVGATGSVLGVDISVPLLERARARAAAGGSGNLQYLLTNAQTYAFAPGQFDLLVSRFGVMFFDDPVAAFANLRKALRRGGRLMCVSWAQVQRNPYFQIARDKAVARLGAPPPTPPTAPGPMAFADVGYVRGILVAAGYADIEVESEEIDLAVPHDADWLANVACRTGPANRVIRHFAARATDVAAIRDEIARAFSRYKTATGLSIPATVNFIRASNK